MTFESRLNQTVFYLSCKTFNRRMKLWKKGTVNVSYSFESASLACMNFEGFNLRCWVFFLRKLQKFESDAVTISCFLMIILMSFFFFWNLERIIPEQTCCDSRTLAAWLCHCLESWVCYNFDAIAIKLLIRQFDSCILAAWFC